MKRIICFFAAVSLVFLSACGKKESVDNGKEKKEIISENEVNAIEEEVKEQIESVDIPLNKYNDERKNTSAFNQILTSDGNKVLVNRYCYIDLIKNKKEINCNIPGCTHETNSCETAILQDANSFLYYEGGMLFTRKNELCFTKNGKEEILLKNTLKNKREEDEGEESEFLYSIVFLDSENIAVCVNGNAFFKYNLKDRKQEKLIVAGDSPSVSVSVVDKETIAITNIDMELYLVSFDKENTVKLFDHCLDAMAMNGSIYFRQQFNGEICLLSCDIRGEKQELLCSNVSQIYFADGNGKAVYVDSRDNCLVHLTDSNTGKALKLSLKKDKTNPVNTFFIRSAGAFSFSEDVYVLITGYDSAMENQSFSSEARHMLDYELYGLIKIDKDWKSCFYGDIFDYVNIEEVDSKEEQ